MLFGPSDGLPGGGGGVLWCTTGGARRAPGGGGGFGTQKFVNQKWRDQSFPIVKFSLFPMMVPLVLCDGCLDMAKCEWTSGYCRFDMTHVHLQLLFVNCSRLCESVICVIEFSVYCVSGEGCVCALDGKGPQRQPQRRLDRRLEEVAKRLGAVTVGYQCH